MARLSNRERTVAQLNRKAEAKAFAYREHCLQYVPKEYSRDFAGFKATPERLMGNSHTMGFSLGQRRLHDEGKKKRCILTLGDLYDFDVPLAPPPVGTQSKPQFSGRKVKTDGTRDAFDIKADQARDYLKKF